MDFKNIPKMYDATGEGPQADVMDMYFCSAPPPPPEYQLEGQFPEPEEVPGIPEPTPLQRAILDHYLHYKSLPNPLKASDKETAEVKLYIAKLERREAIAKQIACRKAMAREIQWRWLFARMAAGTRADARKGAPSNAR